MDRGLPDESTVHTAIALACRAPSVHNTQPWLWRLGDRSVHLYADPLRQLHATDPDGRDLYLSCGAALDHLRVGLAALGWRTVVHRLPDAGQPRHLAAVELHRHDPSEEDIALAAAIPRRRTDRRRYSSWPVPEGHVQLLAERAAHESTAACVVDSLAARQHLLDATRLAADLHAADPAYRQELAAWTGRHGSPDGVPATNTPPPGALPGELPVREFSDPRLHTRRDTAEDDAGVLLVLASASDDPMSQLRAGEAMSQVLLTATSLGLACCPLTEPLEVTGARRTVRQQVLADDGHPQVVLRVGWAPVNADPLPATPRRPVGEVLSALGTPPSPPVAEPVS